MSHSSDTSDSEADNNAFFDAHDAMYDPDGNRQSVRFSETPLSSDVDRVLERVAIKQARRTRQTMPDAFKPPVTETALLPTVNLLTTQTILPPVSSSSSIVTFATAEGDETSMNVDSIDVPDLSITSVTNDDSSDEVPTVIIPRQPPATLPRAKTAPANQYAGLTGPSATTLVTSGATLPRRSAAQRVSSRRLTRAATCMTEASNPSQPSGSQRGVTLCALDLAAEENIIGRRRSIELPGDRAVGHLVGDDDDDDIHADRKSILSTHSGIKSKGHDAFQTAKSTMSIMPDSSSNVKGSANNRSKTRSALSIDELTSDMKRQHNSRLSCDAQTLAPPIGRRSIDVQSINLAMWQAEYVDERFTSNNMSSTNLSIIASESGEHSTSDEVASSSILVRNLDTGELVRLDQVEEASELASPRLINSSGQSTSPVVEEKETVKTPPINAAPIHKRNRSLFARMKGLRSKHSGSSDGSSSPRSPSISHSNTANNGRSTDKSISYIKIRARHKRDVYLRRLVKMQELQTDPVESKLDVSNTPNSTSGRGVWALQISRCGRYLAASGQDHIVRVWCLATAETNKTDRHRPRHVLSDFSARKEIFCSRPMRTWIGHQNDVLELAWSKNNFLLSSSMDKTVKLWHVTRDECLYTFKHPDFVTSVVFHPKDERLFLSGCMDSKLRLWSIPEKRAKYWQEIPNGEVCTAVGFTADGRMCAAGSYSGNCIFYRVSSGLKYHTQILVKSRGKSGRGKKITGIQAMPGLAAGEDKMLITSNDSRIRLYNLRDMSLERRFKGLRNVNSQIRATFSDDGRFVICGSEDRNIYVWDAMDGSLTSRSVSSTSTNNSSNSSPGNGDWRWLRRQPNPPYEQFHAHDNVVTTAVIAPMRTKQLLSDASSKQALAAACIIVSGDYAGQIRVFVNTPPDITTIDGDHDAPHVSKSTTSGNPRRRTMMTTADSTSILSEATWTADTESMMSGHDTIRHERSDSRAETLVRPRIITGGASSIYSVARSDISGKGSSIALTSLTRNQSFFSSFVSLSINDNNSQHIHTADHTLADSASVYSAMTPPSVTITHVPFLDVDPTSPETTSNS